jgi:hypothetical protein
MDGLPSNHRLAERELIKLVQEGEWIIKPDGREHRDFPGVGA